ncbi:CDP-glucose 4,6-dehydratase [Flaviflagellibacter deserti]|uniref:CDP-glucose 4,6-dehydratase n=1 Tax=Flaviflagellibacter deserti TaxID=2267266 RepID=A0ABV9Z2Q4_9HYPH
MRFWQGKRVLLTGHTGFKGGWAAAMLSRLGADLTGLALAPDTEPSLFDQAGLDAVVDHHVVDLRDAGSVRGLVHRVQPDLVLHMAAQPLVLRSYQAPVETFASNVLGTVHLLDALRDLDGLGVVLVVTSDKVYADDGTGAPRDESATLGGRDPYSASKAMTEIAVASYAKSFFDKTGTVVATARGGNVVGGGDYSVDRILPDAWRSARAGTPLVLRNPHAVRPWQHVLDCLTGYLLYVERLAKDPDGPRSLNFGPDDEAVSVETMARTFLDGLNRQTQIMVEPRPDVVETRHLALDAARARSLLDWRPKLDAKQAAAWSADWYRRVGDGEPAIRVTLDQIDHYAQLN